MGLSLATHTAKPSTGMASIPTSRSVSRTKRCRRSSSFRRMSAVTDIRLNEEDLRHHFAKRISNKAVPEVFLIQAYVRDGGKFAGKTGLGLDFPGRVGQDFGLGGSARHRQRLDEAARAVAPVGEVEAHGIAGKGKLLGVNSSFDAIPDARLFEDLRAVGPDGPSAFGNSGPASSAHEGDVIRIEALQFGIQVAGNHSLLGSQLQHIG